MKEPMGNALAVITASAADIFSVSLKNIGIKPRKSVMIVNPIMAKKISHTRLLLRK